MPVEFRSKDFSKGARWKVRWRLDGTGGCKLFRYRADAEAFMAEIEDRIRSNRHTDPRDSCRPLSEVADLWQQGLTGTVKGSTGGWYRLELRCWVLPKWRGGRIEGHHHREDPALVCRTGGGDGALCRQMGLRLPTVSVLDLLCGQECSGLYPGCGGGEPMAGD